MERCLARAQEIFREQCLLRPADSDLPNDPFMAHVMKALMGTLCWVGDTKKYKNARTMQKMNARGRAGQSATTMIGYIQPTRTRTPSPGPSRTQAR